MEDDIFISDMEHDDYHVGAKLSIRDGYYSSKSNREFYE